MYLRSGCGDRSILCGPLQAADSCGLQKAAAQVYRVRYYKTLKIVKISEISEKNIF